MEPRPAPERTPKQPPTDYAAIAKNLTEHPGEYFLVLTASTATVAATRANDIRSGSKPMFTPAGAYDAYSSGNEVIAAYVGTETA